jgi:hypothetical protein
MNLTRFEKEFEEIQHHVWDEKETTTVRDLETCIAGLKDLVRREKNRKYHASDDWVAWDTFRTAVVARKKDAAGLSAMHKNRMKRARDEGVDGRRSAGRISIDKQLALMEYAILLAKQEPFMHMVDSLQKRMRIANVMVNAMTRANGASSEFMSTDPLLWAKTERKKQKRGPKHKKKRDVLVFRMISMVRKFCPVSGQQLGDSDSAIGGRHVNKKNNKHSKRKDTENQAIMRALHEQEFGKWADNVQHAPSSAAKEQSPHLLVSGQPTAPTCKTDSRCWENALPADQLLNAESIVAAIAAAVAWEDYIVPRSGIDSSTAKHKKGQMLRKRMTFGVESTLHPGYLPQYKSDEKNQYKTLGINELPPLADLLRWLNAYLG